MQTAKITVGKQYAYKYDNTLFRFQVDAIVTTKSGRGTTNEIEGHLIRADGTAEPKCTVRPDDLIGPYEEQAALKAQADALKAARQAEEKAKEDAGKRVAELLRRLAGVPFKKSNYRWGDGDDSAIRSSGGRVEITREGVEALLKVLDRRPDLKVVNEE